MKAYSSWKFLEISSWVSWPRDGQYTGNYGSLVVVLVSKEVDSEWTVFIQAHVLYWDIVDCYWSQIMTTYQWKREFFAPLVTGELARE